MRARSARSAMVAVVAALALATGGIAYGASVVGDDSSTADVQPDEGTPGIAPGGTAELLPSATQVPADADSPGDVDKSDGGKKGVKPTKDEGVKNAPVTTS